MFPTPTPLPSAGLTPPFDISIISDYVNAPKLAVDAVGWFNVGLVQTGLWDTVSGWLLVGLVIAATVAIVYHISQLGDE